MEQVSTATSCTSSRSRGGAADTTIKVTDWNVTSDALSSCLPNTTSRCCSLVERLQLSSLKLSIVRGDLTPGPTGGFTMAHYFPDRRIIRELFKIDIVPNKLYVQCAIYERFEFRKSFNCTCGHKTSMKLSKTEGVSTKISAIIESSVEGALGVSGLAQLKSSIKATLGAEVNWSESRTEELNFECD